MTDQELDRIMRRVLLDSLKLDAEKVEKDQCPSFEPTSRHKRQMRAMLADPMSWLHRQEYPLWQQAARRVAVALLACILAFGGIMVFNSTARATIVRWVMEWYGNAIDYLYSGEQNAEALPEYNITELPEGYVEKNRDTAPALTAVTYENSNGTVIYFDYIFMYQGAQTNFVLNEDDVFDVQVNGMEGKFFMSRTEEKMNKITWIDTEQNIQFTLGGYLEYAVLLHMAENVSLCKTMK